MYSMLLMKMDINKIVLKKTQLRNVLRVEFNPMRLDLAIPVPAKFRRVSLIFHIHFLKG